MTALLASYSAMVLGEIVPLKTLDTLAAFLNILLLLFTMRDLLLIHDYLDRLFILSESARLVESVADALAKVLGIMRELSVDQDGSNGRPRFVHATSSFQGAHVPSHGTFVDLHLQVMVGGFGIFDL